MKITSDHAFWMLDSYRRNANLLIFGGRILGEEAMSAAVITETSQAAQAVALLLIDEDGTEVDSAVSLAHADFDLFQARDPEFHANYPALWQSVLRLVYSDGTTLFFAKAAEGGCHVTQ